MTTNIRFALAAAFVAGAVALGLTGCGGSGGGSAGTTLRGKVTVDKKPVPVGTVTAYKGGTKKGETQINPDGSYEFTDLSSGDYQLTVTHTDTATPYGKPVQLPPRYADPSQSGLTAAVNGGANTQDLPLSRK